MPTDVPERFSSEELAAMTSALGIAILALDERCATLRKLVLDSPIEAAEREHISDALEAAERERAKFISMRAAFADELGAAEAAAGNRFIHLTMASAAQLGEIVRRYGAEDDAATTAPAATLGAATVNQTRAVEARFIYLTLALRDELEQLTPAQRSSPDGCRLREWARSFADTALEDVTWRECEHVSAIRRAVAAFAAV